MRVLQLVCCGMMFWIGCGCSKSGDEAAPNPEKSSVVPEAKSKPGGSAKRAVSLPDDFPKDVPLPEFVTVTAALSQDGSTMLQLTSTRSADDTRNYFRGELKRLGWTETQSAEAGSGSFLAFKKGETECTVSVQSGEGVQVMLSVKQPK